MTIKTPIKGRKRTMYEVKETLKAIQYIDKDHYLWKDMGINPNTGRNAINRNAISASIYEKILVYCFLKRIDPLAVFIKRRLKHERQKHQTATTLL